MESIDILLTWKKKAIIKFQELRKFIGQGKHSTLYNTNLDKHGIRNVYISINFYIVNSSLENCEWLLL